MENTKNKVKEKLKLNNHDLTEKTMHSKESIF